MDRAVLLRHLRQARDHIAEGERHIRRQREIVAHLKRDGHNASLASDLLETLEQLQESHIATRDRIKSMMEELGTNGE